MTSTLTAEFRDEFEAERTRLLRRRILWYVAVFVCIGVVSQVLTEISQRLGFAQDARPDMVRFQQVIGAIAWVSYFVYLGVFYIVWKRPLNREQMLRLIFWVIVVITGLTLVLQSALLGRALEGIQNEGGDAIPAAGVSGALLATGLWGIFITHFFASLFIPWSLKESLNPFVVIYAIFVGSSVVLVDLHWWGYLILVAGLLVGAPGAVICWWRHSRFRDKFHYRALRGRYGAMRQELTNARQIHESLFPEPIRTGLTRLDFRYEPMGHIGGDYLYTFRFPGVPGDAPDSEPLSVVVIDVTGHGIAAALTVNRLHGELERLFAEEPDIAPGEVLRSLNRYIHLTLASHSVYATAVCLRIDARSDTLQWASAGHPPMFVKTIDGRLEQLDSTTFVLGACASCDFTAEERQTRLCPGDTLIAYTDGAIEAMNGEGRMLGVEGLRSIVRSSGLETGSNGAGGGMASAILREIDAHRTGQALDDTLIVEIHRPIRV